MIRAIAAIDDKRGIASGGGIPWRIPEDGKYFSDQTRGGIVVMGWATYQEFAQPLPERRNVVVSRTNHDVRPGFELITDVDAFLQQTVGDVWIIGGAGLFASTLQYCDELYLTHVQGDYHCDRIFPPYEDAYECSQTSPWHVSGVYKFQYAIYKKTGKR